MKTRMTRSLLACLLFGLLASAPFLHAQEATPEATVAVIVDPAAEGTQELTIENLPGAEEAETNSAIGDAPVTTGEQPGDISSGSTVEQLLPGQSVQIDETPEVGAIIAAPEGEAPIALDLGAEDDELTEGGEIAADVETEVIEAPEAEVEQPTGVSTLVLLLGIGAVFAVGLLTLARDRFQNNNNDDTPSQ